MLIGLDLGTSGLKGVVLGTSGEVVASARADYPTHRPELGASEQDPHDWAAAIIAVLGELSELVDPATWLGIGLSAMIPTIVVTDMSGEILHPSITWEDARAEPQGEQLRSQRGAVETYHNTGQWLDGRYLLPMYLRLAPQLHQGQVRVLGAKDWILHWLTGVYATDPATATGSGAYNLITGDYDTSILDLVGQWTRSEIELAPVSASTVTYPISDEIAELLGVPRGLPIAVGAADAMAALLGLGVGTPGDIVYLAGTSTVIVGIDETPHFDAEQRFLLTPLALGGYGHEMDLLATGSAQAWLADLLGLDAPDMVAELGRSVQPDESGLPTMLAYVAPGEQGALWDPLLTGVIEGLTLHTSAAHLARALLTAINVESARCVAVWQENSPRSGELHVAGRGIDQATLQELADATGRHAHLCGQEHAAHSAVGAALIVARALGVVPLPVNHHVTLKTSPRTESWPMWQLLTARHDELRTRTR